MADDDARDARDARETPDARDDSIFADTLRAFAARPLVDGASELDTGRDDTKPDRHPDEGAADGHGNRLSRFAAWARWAAAPLGFFLFLAALTAYGVLRDRDRDSGDGASSSAPAPVPTATTAPPAPTTAAPPPTTAATTVPTVALTAPPVPTAPVPPPTTPPPAEPDVATAPVTPTTSAVRFGPACGFAPGELVDVSVNGQPMPPVAADENGCVSVSG